MKWISEFRVVGLKFRGFFSNQDQWFVGLPEQNTLREKDIEGSDLV